MLATQKAALANRLRQRLVALREKELDYYTGNCRMLGSQAALVSGFAYSGIRYHRTHHAAQTNTHARVREGARRRAQIVCVCGVCGKSRTNRALSPLSEWMEQRESWYLSQTETVLEVACPTSNFSHTAPLAHRASRPPQPTHVARS